MVNLARTAALVGIALLLASTGWGAECYSFETDPGLHSWPNPDGSDTYWFNTGHQVLVDVDECIVIGFTVTEGSVGSTGHTTVLGPRSSEESAWPTLQLNLYFGEAAAPGHYRLSLARSGWSGSRYEAEFGATYHAVFARTGPEVANFLLYDAEHNIVHMDSCYHDWPSFDAFQLCYDYYTGEQGFCAWNPAGRVDFLADRGPDLARYLRGHIEYVCVDDCGWCGPTATMQTTFGRLKAIYR